MERKDFIKGAFMGAAALAIPKVVDAEDTTPRMPIQAQMRCRKCRAVPTKFTQTVVCEGGRWSPSNLLCETCANANPYA